MKLIITAVAANLFLLFALGMLIRRHWTGGGHTGQHVDLDIQHAMDAWIESLHSINQSLTSQAAPTAMHAHPDVDTVAETI